MTLIKRLLGFVLLLFAGTLPGPALAYIGPGAGLGAIAAALALAVGLILLIIGLVWFPLKRRFKRRKTAAGKGDVDPEA